MKKYALLIAVIAILSLVSCRKTRTCTCVAPLTGKTYTVQESDKISKKRQKMYCEDRSSNTLKCTLEN